MKGILSIENEFFEKDKRVLPASFVAKIIDAFGFEGNVTLRWAVETPSTFGEGLSSDISGFLCSNLNDGEIYLAFSVPEMEADATANSDEVEKLQAFSIAAALSDLLTDGEIPDRANALIDFAPKLSSNHGFALELNLINEKELDKVEVSVAEFIGWIRAAMTSDCFFTITFVDSAQMQEMNNSFRAKNYATNVLTFDYPDNLIVAADIALCREVLEREAKEQGKTIKEHLAHLTIHGVLHAHGFDHIEESEAQEMEARETEIMLGLGFPNPYSDPTKVHD